MASSPSLTATGTPDSNSIVTFSGVSGASIGSTDSLNIDVLKAMSLGAFEYAHAADPAAMLIYNDYNNLEQASTSSVYGATEKIPFVETDHCDRPLAPYPASKRAAEMLGFTYHHIYGMDFTALIERVISRVSPT